MKDMRFTIRDMLWLTALVAMGCAWWLDARWRDWSIKSAQMRKDYYTLMSDVAREESEKYKRLSEELQRERERAKTKSEAARLESIANP